MVLLSGKSEKWKREMRDLYVDAAMNPQNKDKNNRKIAWFYDNKAPQKLYKYFSDSKYSLDSITQQKIWYSSPNYFNDVFDCDILIDEKTYLDLLLKTYKALNIPSDNVAWKNAPQDAKKSAEDLRKGFEKHKATLGVACFTESDDSLLMWAHYASDHRGVCLEYDMGDINKRKSFHPMPVIYSNERLFTEINTLNPQDVRAETLRVIFLSLTSKSLEWAYEREWRIAKDKKACGNAWKPGAKGASIDMVAPRSMTLGCMASGNFEDTIIDYCQKNHIPLYKMEKDPNIYRLNKKVVLSF